LAAVVCFLVGLALDLALIPFFGASGASAAASAAYCAGGLTALLLYRAREPFRLRALVAPQPGDFEVLRALVPAPLVRPRLQRS
jgi:peptidoglycan biosynthesis protein MviN/MurJ (putative lipid II flippase)